MDYLDHLASLLGCHYLSDLGYLSISQKQAEMIWQLSDETFCLKDYNEAASYILHRNVDFNDIPAAKKAIIQKLLRLHT